MPSLRGMEPTRKATSMSVNASSSLAVGTISEREGGREGGREEGRQGERVSE